MAPVPTDVDDAWNSFWSGEVTFFNSIHVGIGVPITAFGQLHMARRLAQGGVEAARIRTRQAESDVVFTVKKIYYGIQLAKESIKLLNEAIGKLDKKIKSEEERAEEEDGEEEEDELADVNDHLDPYDVLHMRAFKSELERRREEAKQNLELAYDAMRIQLDLHPGAEIGLDSDCLKPKLASLDKEEEFIEGGMKHGHNVNLLDIGVETKRRLYKLEKFKLAPKFGFGFFMDAGRSIGEIRGLQLTDDYNDPFNYTRAGFGFQLQGTIDFHGAYGRIKKSRAEYHKAVYQRIIARRALTMDIRKVYLYAKRAKLNVGRTKKEWSMANQMMFLSKVNVDIGIGDKDKYADALKYLLLSRGRYFKAVFDYNMALAELEKRVGRERYAEYVPTPDVDELEAFRYNGDGEEEEGGWITIDEKDDTYGVQTEDGGVTDGSFEE
jgi:outer membrane protein TolC